ncbi:MAG: precorrin-6A reductase [Hespellia sp.]|nr:precorrin-6A reductase [Hespellia sp.]
MCKKVLVFGGTLEGRKITEYLLELGAEVQVCTATAYGGSLLEPCHGLTISHDRLNRTEMEQLIQSYQPLLVVDATHPYAVEVSENVRAACEKEGAEYLRLLRESEEVTGETSDVVWVESVAEAVAFLKTTRGNIFVTTGSKELSAFTELAEYKERVYARVLSTAAVAEKCEQLGFCGSHLIGMQGPFSKELNVAMLRQTGAAYLVTKESGKAGGFLEKCEAAEEMGVTLVVIGRPAEESGVSFTECKRMLAERIGSSMVTDHGQHVTLVGIGMGTVAGMTVEAQIACDRADALIGAERMCHVIETADFFHNRGQSFLYAYQPDEIMTYIKSHPEHKNIAIVLSGDTGFFSGAKRLIERMDVPCTVICGISSLSYFCSRIGKAWEEVYPISLHGREGNLIGTLQHHQKVFALVGSREGIGKCCEKLSAYGMGQCPVAIGENLSYPTEIIRQGKARDFAGCMTEPLSVFYVENEGAAERIQTPGMPDAVFTRDKVPMTKEEVRVVSLAKLRLQADSVLYDIGAGTGSVSIEAARMAEKIRVYAIEKKELALELLEKNKSRFAVDNLTIVAGEAPHAMENLPMPTHAFIGGSSGNLREILERCLQKNPGIRIVINAITLETVGEAMRCLKELSFAHVEVVQVAVSRAKEVADYHMMMGENPVYVIACEGLSARV